MAKKILFLLGGRSGEHEISLISGKHILHVLDRNRYHPEVVVIQKSGEMTLCDLQEIAALPDNPKLLKTPRGKVIAIRPFRAGDCGPCLIDGQRQIEFDIAFPVLHGPGGEDGTIQGLFEFAGTPVVGNSVKACAMSMDKAITKIVAKAAGFPVIPFVCIYRGESLPSLPWDYPLFVKPASLGSSLGVNKADSPSELDQAIKDAFSMEEKILIEPAIRGREIEIAIFGSRGNLVASPLGEIRCKKGFYSYEAKYVEPDLAELILPAKVSDHVHRETQRIAKGIFEALDCRGMARIDFFLDESDNVLLNEVNTIPGFTPISMYPKLMGLANQSYAELISKLISLAESPR